MFWYYLRDNWKSLFVGSVVGICCIAFILNYVNREFQFKTTSLEPVSSNETENTGTIYDKYLENNEELNKQNTKNIDFNAKPVADTLNKVIYAFDTFMIEQHKELQKDNIVMYSGDIKLYKLLNGGEYKDFVDLISQYTTSEGTIKQALKLYGYGVKNGKVCYQDGENKNAYKINTQYPTDVTYASDYSAEVTVPLVKNSQSPTIYDYEKKPEKDYSFMTIATFSFKKQHGKWLIFNIDIQEEV